MAKKQSTRTAQKTRHVTHDKRRTARQGEEVPGVRLTRTHIFERKVSIAILLFVGLIALVFLATNINQRAAGQATIETYLENKYKQDFVVGFPVREASGFGVEGHLQSVAYPADEPELTFVSYTSSGGTGDQYPAAVWKKAETPKLEDELRRVFGTLPDYTLDIYSAYYFNELIVGATVPTLASTALEYPGKIPYRLRMQTESPIEGSVKQATADQLLKVIQYIKTKNVSATVQYVHKNSDSKTNSGWALSGSELQNINDVSDLVDEYKTWRAQ